MSDTVGHGGIKGVRIVPDTFYVRILTADNRAHQATRTISNIPVRIGGMKRDRDLTPIECVTVVLAIVATAILTASYPDYWFASIVLEVGFLFLLRFNRKPQRLDPQNEDDRDPDQF
jgi:hypothetical protein